VIERLTDLGILDDAAFAAQWVESRDRARPRGERALQAELRRNGIDAGTVAGALDERRERATDGDGLGAEEDAARRLLDRHAAALGRVADPRVRRQRAYALLARNGFGPDVAGDVARSLVLETTASATLDEPAAEPDADPDPEMSTGG
jgi:regulatory protein